MKVPNLKSLRAREKIYIKMRNIESSFVTGPSNVLSAGMYVCTFQPGKFTRCGSEGVNSQWAIDEFKLQCEVCG